MHRHSLICGILNGLCENQSYRKAIAHRQSKHNWATIFVAREARDQLKPLYLKCQRTQPRRKYYYCLSRRGYPFDHVEMNGVSSPRTPLGRLLEENPALVLFRKTNICFLFAPDGPTRYKACRTCERARHGR